MIALRLRFSVGRYHATPWGRHVNEAALAWPPEPVRILRALIACQHRKVDKAQFSNDALADLIDVLAGQLPIYRLPEAVHAHTRHYMPINGNNPALVFDAFARFDPGEPLIVGWPSTALNPEQRAHLDHLAACLGYLGRAESWVGRLSIGVAKEPTLGPCARATAKMTGAPPMRRGPILLLFMRHYRQRPIGNGGNT
jgi:CRISPR-associated protein Csb2